MKHLILGTAGHVDHGKTTLVKALTGVDTDRLPEEKARGMTIELGFTHLELPSGLSLGVVDMPGHEKFIKHMAAGAGGVDIALLIIAADEGIMQQTEEHLEILGLLGIEKAVIALTKKDLVDDEWLGMVKEEVANRIEGTNLQGSAIIPVSALTGSGIPELVAEIDKAAADAAGKRLEPASRLYIDRVFTIAGHGTIVTGTLLGKSIQAGDKLELLPSGKMVRVKRIETHDMEADIARIGQRVALNITGIDKGEVGRGMALATPGWLEATNLIDVEVKLLSDAEPIGHNDRLRLHIGTDEVICRARVPKGQRAAAMFIQLETEAPIYPARGDRFILRAYSPSKTIAGGRVLCAAPPRRKMGIESEAVSIARLASEDASEAADELVKTLSRLKGGASRIWPVDEASVTKMAYMLPDRFKSTFTAHEGSSGAVRLVLDDNSYFIDDEAFTLAKEAVHSMLEKFHKANPLRRGMAWDEIKQKLMPGVDRKQLGALLNGLKILGRVLISADLAWLPDHRVVLDGRGQKSADAMERVFKEQLWEPPDLAAAIAAVGPDSQSVADYLISEGILIKASSEVTFHREAIEAGLAAASNFKGPFTAAMLRDALDTSRKYAIALLEWMDSQDLTQRSGDHRVFRRKLDERARN